MSARTTRRLHAPLARALAHARTKRTLWTLALWAPAAVVVWVAVRAGLPLWMVAALACVLAVAMAVQLMRGHRLIDARWLQRRLDASDPSVEDSSDLLLHPPATPGPLQQLQRRRLEQRLARVDARALAPRAPWMPVAVAWLAGALLALTVLAFAGRVGPPRPDQPTQAMPGQRAQSLQVRVRIEPPAYTGMPAREQAGLDVEVPQGALVAWWIEPALAADAARLRVIGGDVIELQRDGSAWRGERRLAASVLYRIELDGAPEPGEAGPFRIDVVPDEPPELIVERPAQTLTLLERGDAAWELHARASDDHGLGDASLHLTLAQGDGEQVTVSERRVPLAGTGDDGRRRAYRHRVDLAALGFAEGDDLIARIEIADRREPVPNRAQSPALILRWVRERAAAGSGVDGLARDAMPAYFRSQRQIIIDTEALIVESPGLQQATVTARSDALGVDQRILRLRYGQFLGEESEPVEHAGQAYEDEHARDDADADRRDGDAHDGDAHEDDAHEGDGHDDGGQGADVHAHAPDPTAGFGDATGVVAGAGHLHDLPEAATLLDPRTRRLLREALSEMWQAELQLRLGRPSEALPFEYRALDAIKQVQQANRIYLARVGLELPPLDPERRLSGERPRLAPRGDPLQAADRDSPLPAWWTALAAGGDLPWDDVARWVQQPGVSEDPLSVLAELDRLQRDPDCGECRERLRAALWPLLPTEPAAPATRAGADAQGGAYLDALESGDER